MNKEEIKEAIVRLKKEKRRLQEKMKSKKWRDKIRKDPEWLKKEHKRQKDYYERTKVKKFNNGEYP